MSDKEKLDYVFAQSGGKTFKIPASVAAEYEVDASEGPFVALEAMKEASEFKSALAKGPKTPEPSEVGGRSHENTPWYDDWDFGPYIWHFDGNCYVGFHWHPIPGWPLAADADDC